jgi:hypothetical protein
MGQDELDAEFLALRNQAVLAAGQYMRTRCPPELQPFLEDYIAGLEPQPLPTDQAIVTDSDVIDLHDFAGALVGTVEAQVINNTLNWVKIDDGLKVVVADGASVVVVDALDAPVAGSPGTATIAAGVLTNVKLTA